MFFISLPTPVLVVKGIHSVSQSLERVFSLSSPCVSVFRTRLGVSVTGDWVSGNISLPRLLSETAPKTHPHLLGTSVGLSLADIQDHVRSST